MKFLQAPNTVAIQRRRRQQAEEQRARTALASAVPEEPAEPLAIAIPEPTHEPEPKPTKKPTKKPAKRTRKAKS